MLRARTTTAQTIWTTAVSIRHISRRTNIMHLPTHTFSPKTVTSRNLVHSNSHHSEHLHTCFHSYARDSARFATLPTASGPRLSRDWQKRTQTDGSWPCRVTNKDTSHRIVARTAASPMRHQPQAYHRSFPKHVVISTPLFRNRQKSWCQTSPPLCSFSSALQKKPRP